MTPKHEREFMLMLLTMPPEWSLQQCQEFFAYWKGLQR